MKKLKIGIIGVGGMGQLHCEACKKIDEVELTAVCDVHKPTVEQVATKYNIKPYTDYKELIDSGNVEAVIVATPHYFHPPMSIYAMEKGIHVLSEKPIAVTVDEADKMISIAKRTKMVFSVMFQLRTLPHYKTAKKLINEGKIGNIYRTLMILGWFRTQAYYDSAGWRATWKTEGGGVLINQAPHMFDIFCWLAGVPVKVYAEIKTRRHKIEVEDEVHAMLQYSNGALGYLYASVNEAPTQDRIEIVGEKGKLIIEGTNLMFTSLKQPVQKFCDTSPEMWASPEIIPENIIIPKEESGHGVIIRNFARAVLYGEDLISPGVEGINSLELANAILYSGMEKKEVELPVNREEFRKLFDKLVASSKTKIVKEDKRITDPKLKI